MPAPWTTERLSELPPAQIRSLHAKTIGRSDPEAKHLAALILESGLLVNEKGGLPWDHPTMLEIESICSDPDAVAEAIAAAEQGLPALAGMEHRLTAALGDQYGGQYTTNHAGRCIANEMLARGWKKAGQKPMPAGFVAKSATTFVKKEAR